MPRAKVCCLPLLAMCCRHHKREGMYAGLVQAVAEYCVKHRAELPLVIWRDNSPQHFAIEHGEYPHPDEASGILGPVFQGCKPIQVRARCQLRQLPWIGCDQAAPTSGQLGTLGMLGSRMQELVATRCSVPLQSSTLPLALVGSRPPNHT